MMRGGMSGLQRTITDSRTEALQQERNYWRNRAADLEKEGKKGKRREDDGGSGDDGSDWPDDPDEPGSGRSSPSHESTDASQRTRHPLGKGRGLKIHISELFNGSRGSAYSCIRECRIYMLGREAEFPTEGSKIAF